MAGMSDRNDDELLVADWLKGQGYESERPTWLPEGERNPDFWAQASALAPSDLWVEVKSIEEDSGIAVLSRYNDIIREFKIPAGLHGEAILNIEPHAIEQSVRWALKMFSQQAPKYVGQKVTLAFVQQNRNGREIRRAEVDTSPKEILWVRGDVEGAMSPPLNVCEDSFAETKVFYPDCTERTEKTYEFFDWNASKECSLVAYLDPGGRELDGIVSMSGGDLNPRRERIIRAIEDANSQIRIASATKSAPAIVAIVLRGPFAEDFQIQTACYGHLMVPITLHDDGSIKHGDQRHDANERKAVFRADKNRHVSAVVHVRRDGTATYFPNPYAHNPVDDDSKLYAGVERANVNIS
jgi:hypothetical protein